MTTVTPVSVPAPRKPWQPTRKDIAITISTILLGIIAGYLAVEFSPLKGKLGFALAFIVVSSVLNTIVNVRKYGRKALSDSIATALIYTGATIVILPVASILAKTVVKGLPGLKPSIFTGTMKTASFLGPINEGGLLHAIVGTLMMVIIAMIISVPMGIITALYLTEIKGKGSGVIQFIVQAMSGVPSVVAGLFIFTAIILTTPVEPSGFAGGLALAILMVPTVTRTAQEVLLLVPNDLREAGLAMGATQWKTVSTIVVPAARNGLITATILGIARITGETAPLIFTIGGADKLNLNPFKDYQAALPLYVWKGLNLGSPESLQRAWTAIFVLLVFVLLLFTSARTLGTRKIKK